MKHTSLKLDDLTEERIRALCAKMQLSRTNVIRQAVRKLAEAEGVQT